MIKTNAQSAGNNIMKTIPISVAESAIDLEPELTDEMPDEIWEHVRDDRDAMTELIKITVDITKKSIHSRLHRLIRMD